MAATNYKVTLHDPKGNAVTTFGVTAANDDDAKRLAQEWLTSRGYRVRAISFSAKQERALVAYAIAPGAE